MPVIQPKHLSLLWACLLLCAALTPSPTQAKRKGGFRGRGTSVSNRLPATHNQSQNRGGSKTGLKLAGAAAAGALGGAAVGYGLGSLGRNHHYGGVGGYGRGYGHGGYGYDASEEDRREYYPEGYGPRNLSDYRYQRGAAGPGPVGWGAVPVLVVALLPLVWVQLG